MPHSGGSPPEPPVAATSAAGGMAPGRRLGMLVKVIQLRFRFLAILAATGLFFASWDSLANLFEKWARPSAGRQAAAIGVESYCPMHPAVVGVRAGSCPICGMPLARRGRGEAQVLPPGVLSRVRLAPGQVEQAGIRTVEVGPAPSQDRLSTAGLVGVDESRRFEVAYEVRGRARIERLYVHSVGERVRAGQRLAELSIYEVAQAIRALVEATDELRRAPATSAASADLGSMPGDPRERLRLATQELQVLGVHANQIDAILSKEPTGDFLPILAPIDGLVVRKAGIRGQYVSEGTLLLEIVDPGRVWVDARVFEDQVGLIGVGQEAAVAVPAFPGESFRGHVEQLAPALDAATHTLAVRLGIENSGERLRAGMVANVEVRVARGAVAASARGLCPVTRLRLGAMGPAIPVELPAGTVSVCCEACVPKLRADPQKYLEGGPEGRPGPGRVVSVPAGAVIDTGTQAIVYVEARAGVFEGRAVVVGPRSGDMVPVLDGLAPGDRVAEAGAFLIDAETRLRPAGSRLPATLQRDRTD